MTPCLDIDWEPKAVHFRIISGPRPLGWTLSGRGGTWHLGLKRRRNNLIFPEVTRQGASIFGYPCCFLSCMFGAGGCKDVPRSSPSGPNGKKQNLSESSP